MQLGDGQSKGLPIPEAGCQIFRGHLTSESSVSDLSQTLVGLNCPKTFQVFDMASAKNVFESMQLNLENNGHIKNFFMSDPLSLLIQFEDLSLHMIESKGAR